MRRTTERGYPVAEMSQRLFIHNARFRKAIATRMTMKCVPTHLVEAHLGCGPGLPVADQPYAHIVPENHCAVIFDLSKAKASGGRAARAIPLCQTFGIRNGKGLSDFSLSP